MMYTARITVDPRGEAVERHRILYQRARLGALWRLLMRRCRRLDNLMDIQHHYKVENSAYGGVTTVPLDQIRGSEGRVRDFDPEFRPLKAHNAERWINIAIARLRETPLPPVELVRVNDSYYVRDGHHRISVAKSFHQADIDAQVTTWYVTKRADTSPLPSCRPVRRTFSQRLGELREVAVAMVARLRRGRLATTGDVYS
jgi:hypothetical protein